MSTAAGVKDQGDENTNPSANADGEETAQCSKEAGVHLPAETYLLRDVLAQELSWCIIFPAFFHLMGSVRPTGVGSACMRLAPRVQHAVAIIAVMLNWSFISTNTKNTLGHLKIDSHLFLATCTFDGYWPT